MEKIRQCCISSSSGIAEQLRGFQGPNFRPSEFKELLRQTLGIHLKPKEAGALIRYFPAEDGLSLCNADFVAYVLKTYRLETERQKRERRLKQSEKESTLRAQERNRSKEVVVELPFDSTDESSCLRKLTAAVLKFSTTSALYTEGLREIKDNSFRPKAFRERFYRIFQTSLTSKESRVLLSALDSSGSESIDGKSFLTAFYKLQRELAVRADMSDNEIMSILRAEDCSRPLVSSFNSPIKPLTMTQPSIFKRVDRLKFIADRRPDSTPSPQLTKQERLLRMTKLEPLAASDASTAIFLLKDRRALKKQNERDEPAMSRGPTVPNKKTVNNPVSTRRREFVFPALLTSAPIFSLGGFESNSSSHLEEDASDQ